MKHLPDYALDELSLFSGIGGGILGTKYMLGWRTIGYVERDPYCQRVLRQRCADRILDTAPIFGDINEFISDGYAAAYQGMVDVITAGFPCQPFSVAGKGLGEKDPRNLWPATCEAIRIVQPRYCLLENVPGLVSKGYLVTILRNLAEIGYDAEWRILSAAELGAPHKRDRLWIRAYADSERVEGRSAQQIQGEPGLQEREGGGMATQDAERLMPGTPRFIRSSNDVPDYVDRVKSIGNGQVPSVAAAAWYLLGGE